MPVLQIHGLTKRYGNGKGIFDLNLTVEAGEILGYLGPNGAGKSTTIRTLMGFLRPDGGEAHILGHNVVTDSTAVRANVGYLSSEVTLYPSLTGAENISFSLNVRGVPHLMKRAAELARHIDVDLSRKIKTLSRGLKQKVSIITALAHDPAVLILDEPTTGLDPLAQEILHAILRNEVNRGKTLLFSSHTLSEVEQLCDRVAIIRDGKIIKTDTVHALKQQRVKKVQVEFAGEVPDMGALLGVQKLTIEGRRASFVLVQNLPGLVKFLEGRPIVDLSIQDPSLEEVFRTFYAGGEA